MLFRSSLANFILVKWPQKEGEAILNSLKAQGIYLREMDDMVGLDKRYARIAVRTRDVNQILIEKLHASVLSLLR